MCSFGESRAAFRHGARPSGEKPLEARANRAYESVPSAVMDIFFIPSWPLGSY